ncbi:MULTISPECIES: UDP-4-amino-4,6-dideoxy-N-acetyl-beta-L-altrosamine transaminase [Thalassospira]|uniref:Pyridoxal-5'-phosphate-dependent protein n=2 Tax=Thalassospira TaxID=168934 RepID=A0A367WE79_9PROT|nr:MULTISPECIES: UDP-4-amino-4,6-dideoxy-N-acetyl-beta-L-altrosamine transaminase [Thalassospira]MDG4717670.1 UDP-4-amino-4,6-dideoxy-N-acetyl-beta-L-altrosamine transaminase [Thalassospira sp. FZY0004]RCK38871.1 hypothetical protein TH19_03470 [Thalassospira profundimaris]
MAEKVNSPESENGDRLLPYGRQYIDDDDIDAVVSALRSDYLTTGPLVAKFEHKICEITGATHAAAVSNGTAALHLAYLSLGIGEGDIVIVPSITFLSSAYTAMLVGAEIVFSDVDSKTGLMTANHLRNAISQCDPERIKAVCVVHLNGQCADMAEIWDIAKQYNIRVVEDACHAIGGKYKDRTCWENVGSCKYSDLTVFSFHPVKTIAMGEGGAVVGRCGERLERIRSLRNHGMTRDVGKFTDRSQAFSSTGVANPWYYEQHELGYNYRVPDILCALGISQLSKIDMFVKKRRDLVDCYRRMLGCYGDVLQSTQIFGVQKPAWHLYVCLIDFEKIRISRADVMERLRKKNILTNVHYIPLYRQPVFSGCGDIAEFPGAEAYYAQCLSLPLFFDMEEREVERVVNSLVEVVNL